jgi:hypothetical protein
MRCISPAEGRFGPLSTLLDERHDAHMSEGPCAALTVAVRRNTEYWVVAVVCAVLLAACGGSTSTADSPLKSWNRHVTARPVVASVAEILGTATGGPHGGATRAGGWRGGVSLADHRRYIDRKVVPGSVDQRRMVPPPSNVDGKPVFVEVDNVEIVWQYDNGAVADTDHDTSGNACVAGVPRSNLTCIHIEIDGSWKAAGWAPTDFPLNKHIDVQGYIYWDVPHVEEGVPQDSAPSAFVLGHYGTGWEIHPVSAWRLHAS